MNVPNLLNRITTECAKISGWCSEEKAIDLAMAILVLRPANVLDLGVWFGKSTIPMALACSVIGKGIVHAVDPWTKAAAVADMDKPNAEWWGNQDYQAAYQSFKEKVDALDLNRNVVIHRQKSDDYVPPPVLDLAHIDGNHGPQAIADVNRFAPSIRYGGIVCLDDINWSTDGVAHVSIAVNRLLKLGFEQLSHTKIEGVGEWAMFQRVRAAGR
jgi:predicted O-methyltransferase YrrM